MSFISQRLQLFDSTSFQRAVEKKLELTDAIDLSIGIPEELTAEHIKAAGIKAIQQDKTEYTPANGIVELRAALADKLHNENGVYCTEDTVTIVPGLTTGQLLVYMAILDPGDEVIVLEPYYPPYPHLVSMLGAHPIYVSTMPSFQPDIAVIEAAITTRTKAIVINTPNNPSGAVYSEPVLRQLAELAAKHNVLVISDEIYEHFVYEKKHFSIGSIYKNTITMNGFSKEYAMTGWRIGYITGPADIIQAINSLQQYIVFSASSVGQHAALAALHNRPKLTEKYKEKRQLVMESLERLNYTVHGMDGAFYSFIKTPKDMIDTEFVESAAQLGLILIPGRAFSRVHGYVRISYGANIHDLRRGMIMFEQLANSIY